MPDLPAVSKEVAVKIARLIRRDGARGGITRHLLSNGTFANLSKDLRDEMVALLKASGKEEEVFVQRLLQGDCYGYGRAKKEYTRVFQHVVAEIVKVLFAFWDDENRTDILCVEEARFYCQTAKSMYIAWSPVESKAHARRRWLGLMKVPVCCVTVPHGARFARQ
jgi:hypothetical protein